MNLKHSIILISLAYLLININQVSALSVFCTTLNSGSISCGNFTSFAQLDFSGYPETFQSISLEPSESILFDSSLDFQDLSLMDSYDVTLSNINGFDLVSVLFSISNYLKQLVL